MTQNRSLVVTRERILLSLLGLMLVWTGLNIYQNASAFHIKEARFSAKKSKNWPTNAKSFRPIDLPFMLKNGYFQVDFTSDQHQIDLDIYGHDCVREIYLDGKRIYRRAQACRRCASYSWHPGYRCKTTPVTLEVSPGKVHRLAVGTGKAKRQPRKTHVFFVEHRQGAFWWRLGALFILGTMLSMAFLILRQGAGAGWKGVVGTGRLIWANKAFVFVVIGAIAARIIVAPAWQVGDIFDSAIVYAEDFFHKTGWDYADLSTDYTSAKYGGKSHMHKPPGLYYQFVILRGLFGFGTVYYIYLTAIPAILGDILLASVVYRVLNQAYSKSVAQAGALGILLSAGFFVTSGIMNRADSLPIALLALALLNLDKKRFILYLGLAVGSKHLAIFVVPWLFFDRRTVKPTLLAGLVTLTMCLPYLLDDAALFLERLSMPQLDKKADGLTWMRALGHMGFEHPAAVARYFTRMIPVVVLILPLLVRVDKWTGAALSYLVFILMCKNVHDHYLMWSVIPLLITYIRHKRILCLGAAAFGTLSMFINNMKGPYISGSTLQMYASLLAIIYLVTFLDLMIHHWHPSRPWKKDDASHETTESAGVV